MADPLIAITLFAVKHFIVDFPLQAHPYQYLNKGTYGHTGGILHSGLHGLATIAVLSQLGVGFIMALVMGAVDYVANYHIDWAKMNIGKAMGWGPTTSEWFWILLGLDQLLHFLTYIGIVWFVWG